MRPQQLREELQHSGTTDLRRRRGIVVVSLIGMASMAMVTLYQRGLIRHLPDPPLRRFDSDRVNASDTAYQYGVPDGTLTLAGHATYYLFYQMPVIEKRWCGYCLVDAVAHIGAFALTLPEAARAFSVLFSSTSNDGPRTSNLLKIKTR